MRKKTIGQKILAWIYCDARDILRNPSCPVDLLEKAAAGTCIISAVNVAGNPACPPDILRRLAEDELWGNWKGRAGDEIRQGMVQVRLCLGSNPSCPVDVLEKLASINPLDEASFPAIRNARLPVTKIVALTRSDDETARCVAAENPSCPPKILVELLSDPCPGVLAAVAGNPSTPPETLQDLPILGGLNDNFAIVLAVAGNPSTPPETFVELAETGDVRVLTALAYNPSSPDFALPLAASENPEERSVAAWATGCPDVLAKLAWDEDEDVRAAVAFNSRTPVSALAKLRWDRAQRVRELAQVTSWFIEFKGAHIRRRGWGVREIMYWFLSIGRAAIGRVTGI